MDNMHIIKESINRVVENQEALKNKVMSQDSELGLLRAMITMPDKQEESNKEKEFLNYEEMSAWLGLPTPTIKDMVYKNEIPYYKLKGVKFNKNEIAEWLRNHRVATIAEDVKKYNK